MSSGSSGWRVMLPAPAESMDCFIRRILAVGGGYLVKGGYESRERKGV